MSWFDNLPWRRNKQQKKWAGMLSGSTPLYSQFGDNIYSSDVVQQALSCIVNEMKKLNPVHVRHEGLDTSSVSDSIQKVLNHPNNLMTRSELIEKMMWSLLLNCNAFVIPTYYTWTDESTGTEKRYYTGLYPINPTLVEFEEDSNSVLYIKFTFANQETITLPYADVIHVRWKYSVNEYMGGNSHGQSDNDSLLKTLEINQSLLNGIASAMNSSMQITGVVNYNTMLDKGSTMEEIKRFEEMVQNSKTGILPLDLKSTYTPIKKDVKLIDADTLKFIDEKILRTWGVPVCILTGDYTPAQYESFYQKTLETFIISIGQAFTKTLFTDRQKSYGHEVIFYPKSLIFMSVDQKIEMVRLLGDRGELFSNEARTAFGFEPLPELEGVRMMSLNYVDTNISKDYQLKEVKDSERKE